MIPLQGKYSTGSFQSKLEDDKGNEIIRDNANVFFTGARNYGFILLNVVDKSRSTGNEACQLKYSKV